MSVDSCVAVGSALTKTGSVTLAESWNGEKWTVVASPNPKHEEENVLNDVHCVTTGCIAVGTDFNFSGSTYPLIEEWNGSHWTIVSGAPDPGELAGVSCWSSSACMVVGSGSTGTFTEEMIASRWTVLKSPDPKGSDNSAALEDVSCTGANSCEAVGDYTRKGSDLTYNLAESWNGSSWELAP